MNQPPLPSSPPLGRLWTIFLSAVIAVAVIGFFVGIGQGVPQPDPSDRSSLDSALSRGEYGTAPHRTADTGSGEQAEQPPHGDGERTASLPRVIDAISYAEMPAVAGRRSAARPASLNQLPQPEIDPLAELNPNEADKRRSSEMRASRRAYNGAPPVIPHAVHGSNDAACYECHSQGRVVNGLRANLISHGYLANCTQCHAPPAPRALKDHTVEVRTTFAGLPAPSSGQRAYPGAPPTIPHSQWMRENCTACHGANGWPGMESTHPWRTNCTQCHAPSALLDQAIVAFGEARLPPPQLLWTDEIEQP